MENPLERFKFTRIAHADHLFHSPINADRLATMLGLVGLARGARVVDFGCGNAEVLIQCIERYGATGVGVDISPFALAEARERASTRVPSGSLDLHECPALEYHAERAGYDLALCIGAADALGGYRQTLEALARVLRPGGHAIIGEPFWRRTPAPEYLEAIGAHEDDYRTHAENAALARVAGLRFLYASVSSEDDWDHYEGLYCRAVERYVAAHPHDPDGDEMLARIRNWQDLYLRFGRDTLGFALYLLAG
jgi:SAM-dependent methyltransferase